jgi:hypothetical protein
MWKTNNKRALNKLNLLNVIIFNTLNTSLKTKLVDHIHGDDESATFELLRWPTYPELKDITTHALKDINDELLDLQRQTTNKSPK